ncbi:MAG: Ig-like domain-containing protein, partial [Betaproteobacteria bacterium]
MPRVRAGIFGRWRAAGGRAACTMLLAGMAFDSVAAALWLADARALRAVDSDTGQVVARVEITGVTALAPARRGGTWALAANQLIFVSTDGRHPLRIDVAQLGYGRGTMLAADPFDDSAWVVTSQRLLAHFDKEGRRLGAYTLPAQPQALAIALDQSVWIAGPRGLWRFSHAGLLAPAPDVPLTPVETVAGMAIDSLAGRAWLIGRNAVTAVATEGGAAPVQVMDIGSEIRGSALDPRTGTLWLATEAGLIAVTADAQGLTATARGSRELASVNVLAYDAATDRLVAGFADSVIALDREGGLRTLAVRDGHFELLAGSPFHLLPRVSLIRPPEGASLAESRPEIELYVEALCNDLPCEVPPGYLAGLRLTASLGDRLISEAFRFDPGRGRATAVTPSTLAEGENRGANRFTARATDAFGHESAPIDTAWTLLPPIRLVDSTKAPNQRPVVAMTAPADGARFVPGVGITLSATAADSDGTIAKVEFYRDGSTLLGTSVANPYALVWSNVAAGTYSLAAKATDNKGATTTSAPVSIVVAPPLNSPPTIVIDAPGEGTTFPAGGNLTLTASASDTDGTIARLEFYDGASLLGSVTGGASALTASWAVASLASGAHTLKATAIDNAGAGASATVRVQATAAPLVVITQPAACLLLEAPADVTLQADAFGPDVAIAQVAFYRGATLIGVATKEPYAVAWNGIAAGTYQ